MEYVFLFFSFLFFTLFPFFSSSHEQIQLDLRLFFGGENAHSGDRKRHSGMWCLAGYP
jgi:hypothetical protein